MVIGNITIENLQIEESIQIDVDILFTDYNSAPLKIEISSVGNIKEILFDGDKEVIPVKTDGKYTINKNITENGSYTIIVIDENGLVEKKVIDIKEITEDLDIYTVADLTEFRDRVNDGATYEGKTIKLMADLDLIDECKNNTESWIPIGKDESKIFKGTFKGNGHIINNLYIDTVDDYQSLFGNIEESTIEGIIVADNSQIKGGNYVAGIVGYSKNSIIENCKNYATINATGKYSAGIVAYIQGNQSVLQKCINYGDITSTSEGVNIAGIVASSMCSIKYCGNYGNITFKTKYAFSSCNGIAYLRTEGTSVEQCFNRGIITISDSESASVNGIVNYSLKQNVKDCYNSGNIIVNNSSSSKVAGIGTIGYTTSNNYANVTNCYNIADIIVENTASSYTYVGGVISTAYTTQLKNCYNAGNIKLNDTYATTDIGTGTNNIYLGKIVAFKTANRTNITNCLSVTLEELKTMSETLGDCWTIVNGENNGYPILKWEVGQ